MGETGKTAPTKSDAPGTCKPERLTKTKFAPACLDHRNRYRRRSETRLRNVYRACFSPEREQQLAMPAILERKLTAETAKVAENYFTKEQGRFLALSAFFAVTSV
jgi:hypothetical protein